MYGQWDGRGIGRSETERINTEQIQDTDYKNVAEDVKTHNSGVIKYATVLINYTHGLKTCF